MCAIKRPANRAGNHMVSGCYVPQTGFIAAMAANLAFGDYDNPAAAGTHLAEWIIVSTWGRSGDFLSLSRTNVAVASDDAAPPGLQPAATHLGILLAPGLDDFEAEYLLVRHRPPNVPVGGVFHPSDGFVRIQRQAGALCLIARGRYAHCHGRWEGQPVVCDVPNPAPGSEMAHAWHLTATRRPWIGEFASNGSN
jgi:hypothetical protein